MEFTRVRTICVVIGVPQNPSKTAPIQSPITPPTKAPWNLLREAAMFVCVCNLVPTMVLH